MNRLFLDTNSNNRKSRRDFIQVKSLCEILDDIQFDQNLERGCVLKVESPLFTTLCGMTRASNRSSGIFTNNKSVNRILLDAEPQLNCSCLLVAHRFTKMKSRNDSGRNDHSLMLHETTLFPKVKGAVSLCLMVFAPNVELRLK